ncbi:MAG: NAD(P)/FAD-dependent oxidoreductase [Chitinophagaceae bacterium]|nr:NAD(P)/FAD-dependent oxidoreductase [Chitinophagaceae bacterium]
MKVVIAGGGFGGMRLAKKLNNRAGFEVVLVDRFNYHQFQPLFYQVATGGLDASNISFPLRKVFHRSKNVRIRLAEIMRINTDEKIVVTDQEEISYDVLVLAMGAGTNFFGQDSIATHAFPMKSTVEALQLRYQLLQNFEQALTEKDPLAKQRLLNIAVVGGGPTGVEISGALAEMKKYVLPNDYPELDFNQMHIYLLEGGTKLLGAMSGKSSEQSARYLTKLGVEVMTGALVKNYDGNTITLGDENRIETSTVIWAAGIKGNIPAGINESLIARGNRIKTDRHCQVIGVKDVYAIGDLGYMETPKYPKGHPQVAPLAIQQADMLAGNLRLIERKAPPESIVEFEYRDKGSMATVGRNLAVVDMPKPKLHFGGFFAWMIWMGLHLMLILGVKNRFFVFCNWLYNYITYDQNLRLIFREFKKVQ